MKPDLVTRHPERRKLDIPAFLLGFPRLELGSRSFLLGAPRPELDLSGFLLGPASPELDFSTNGMLTSAGHRHHGFVNRFGHYARGIDEIVALHAPIHETIYRDSTLENELINVAHIADGAAVIHFWSRLAAGAAHPSGPHTVDTLILAVLTRQNEIWRIRALENVTLTNPRTGEPILRG